MTEENNNKLEKLAADVLRLSRNQLLVNLRFLDAALSRLEPRPVPEITFATDGQYLAYGPKHVLRCYKTDRRIPVRDCLHIIFHCIYRHMFVHTLVDHVAWDLACDIAVEACITGLGGTDFRPVFSYVDELIRQKEFQNLKGMIYFTDGYGRFPTVPPAYKTAFVFLEEEQNSFDVPPWAMSLILEEAEILEDEPSPF